MNPLLNLSFDIPFDRIQAAHVEPAIRKKIDEAAAAIEAVASDGSPPSYENTLEAMEQGLEPLEIAMTVVGHLESVANTPELRAAYNAVVPEVSAFFASIPLHAGLWARLKSFSESEAAQALEGARKRLLEKTLADFRRHGADLPEEGKERLRAISREIAELTSLFSQNVLDETSAFERLVTDPTQLAGLPPSAVEAARESAAAKGQEGWRFTLHAPSYIALMTYLDDASLREEVWRAFDTRGTSPDHDNRPLLRRILELRKEKAKLLGFEDFADLVLEDRMAKTGKQAADFVQDLRRRAQPSFEKEKEELLAFRREVEGEGAIIEPWDLAYWSEKQRQARFAFDEEELRPYFPLKQAMDGLFRICERLFGIRIEEEEGVPVWHETVRTFRILNEEGALLCRFYADLFPRDEKRGGAWMNAFITGTHRGDQHTPHLGLICGNFTPPTSDKPSLLTHREVETLFHEFGHLLHHALSEVEVRSLAGTQVAWDFVELPSQIMENWCWEREALDIFARHYESGEKIPEELFQKLLRTRTYRAATAMVRQLGFAEVDLAMHREWDEAKDGDLMAFARRILQSATPAPLPQQSAMIASFNHLFSSEVGYASGYYSYKWAEVLDADAFGRFREEGIFAPEVGRAFREEILSKGDSQDPAQLFRAFRGRDPEVDALLSRSGLQASGA